MWDWLAVGDNDGMFTLVDPTDSRWLYTTRQYGGHTRVDQKLGYETNIRPQRAAGRSVSVPVEHADPHLAARQQRDLCGRADAAALDRSR